MGGESGGKNLGERQIVVAQEPRTTRLLGSGEPQFLRAADLG